MKYYIKKAGHQELGSVMNGSKPSRGRYLYISKNPNVLSNFPPLSKTVKNDSALLSILPLHLKKKVYCNYIYHNDKYTIDGGTRNELRLYLNSSIEARGNIVEKDDVIILRKGKIAIDDEEEEIYFMMLVKSENSQIYDWLCSQITNSSISGGHCIYDGDIHWFEEEVVSVVRDLEYGSEINERVISTINSTQMDKNISDLFNSTSFRDFVMVGYENLCAVTRSSIRWNGLMNLEAAHIKPKSHGGIYLPSNGIALSRDMHWSFDKGFFTILDDLTIQVHEDVPSDYLHQYNGQKIYVPKDTFLKPDISNLKYHRDNVYGLFKRSGRL